MKFHELGLEGLYHVQLEPIEDERGAFARTFCSETFASQGLPASFPQSNLSWNRARGTLRGLHYHRHPYQEAKLIRCTRGAVFDVVVDIRPGSSTFGRTVSMVLEAGTQDMLFLPQGMAHGFQTLKDDTELVYQMSIPYQGGYATGIRYDDPGLAIPWPETVTAISEADRALPAFGSDQFRKDLQEGDSAS